MFKRGLAGAQIGDVVGRLITDDQTIKFPVGLKERGRAFTSAMASHHQTARRRLNEKGSNLLRVCKSSRWVKRNKIIWQDLCVIKHQLRMIEDST